MTKDSNSHEILEAIGHRILSLRNENGWTQEELGERAKCHRTHISRIEDGQRNHSLISLARIAKAFDLTLSKLLEGI